MIHEVDVLQAIIVESRLTGQIGTPSRHANSLGALDDAVRAILAARWDNTTLLGVKIDHDALLGKPNGTPSDAITIPDPRTLDQAHEFILHGLALPDGHDLALLLSTSADQDLPKVSLKVKSKVSKASLTSYWKISRVAKFFTRYWLTRRTTSFPRVAPLAGRMVRACA